jgi:hypothetical protein
LSWRLQVGQSRGRPPAAVCDVIVSSLTLIDAYRTLDDASNRGPSDGNRDREIALEKAVSDIQLFGSEAQVRLADEFARDFATKRGADTTKLLEELRRRLRKELRLKSIGERRVWLRIVDGDPWKHASSYVTARVSPAIAAMPNATTPQTLPTAPGTTSQEIADRFAQLTSEVATTLGLPPDATIEAVLKASEPRISTRSLEGLDGLRIMNRLAQTDRKRIGLDEVAEFDALAEGLAFAIRRELSQAPTAAPLLMP